MKTIKNLILVLATCSLGFTVTSCNSDDVYNEKHPNYGYFEAKMISVNQDSIQPVNFATSIKILHERINSCDEIIEVRKLDASKYPQNDSVISLAIYGAAYANPNCQPVINTDELNYKYTPTKSGRHTIRVWAGKDLNNRDSFIEYSLDIQ